MGFTCLISLAVTLSFRGALVTEVFEPPDSVVVVVMEGGGGGE